MRLMKVSDLKKLIATAPEDAVLVVPAPDHSMRPAMAGIGTVLFDRKSYLWTQDYGEDSTPEADYGKRIPALIVE